MVGGEKRKMRNQLKKEENWSKNYDQHKISVGSDTGVARTVSWGGGGIVVT